MYCSEKRKIKKIGIDLNLCNKSKKIASVFYGAPIESAGPLITIHYLSKLHFFLSQFTKNEQKITTKLDLQQNSDCPEQEFYSSPEKF